MSGLIQVQVNKLARMLNLSAQLDRTARIQQQKQQIYAYRNQLLSQQLNRLIQADDMGSTAYGKPYLVHFPAFHFNHSHSQKHYALASSSQLQDLGVDIEDLDRKVRFAALARHAFHADELQRWNQLGQDPAYWFKVWTTKEAVLKACGLGVRLNLNELNTHVHPLYDAGICHHPLIGHFAYQNFQLTNSMLTLAWRSSAADIALNCPKIELLWSA